MDINTAPESGFNLTQPVPIYKIADTQVSSSRPDGDGLLFLHGLRTNRDAGLGRLQGRLTSIRTTCSAEAHFLANPFDRPAGRGLRLEVLHDREPL